MKIERLRHPSAPLLAAAACAVACLLAAHGCAGPESQRAVTIVHDGPPLTLDPNAHREIVTRSVLSNCFEGLVGFDPAMRIVPQLAASWENPDDLTWVFHLRPGVRFHNGRPLESGTVALAIRKMSGTGEKSGIRLSSIDTVFTPDSATVVIRTSRPDAVLLNQLTKVYVVSLSTPLAFPCDTGACSMAAGTGPYVMDRWQGGEMCMKRWEGYWGDAPSLPAVRLLFREGHRGTEGLLRRGEADIAAGINILEVGRISRLPKVRIKKKLGLAVRYLRADPSTAPYSDPAVRRAISLAIDRQELVDSTAAGYGRPASQMVTEAVFGFNPSLPPLAHDPYSARALLAGAGYRDGPRLLLDVLETRRKLGGMIKRQLEEVGFSCSLCVHGREEFFLGAGRPSRFFLSAVASTSGDASAAISLDSRGAGSIGVMNASQRLAALQRAMAEFTARLEYIPLFSEDDLSAVSDRVEWEPRQDLLVLGKDIKLRQRNQELLR